MKISRAKHLTTITVTIGLFAALLACKQGESPGNSDSTSASKPTAERTETAEERAEREVARIRAEIMQAKTLPEVLKLTVPYMKDGKEEFDFGTSSLTLWSLQNLTWSELQTLPKTKYPLVMKDPDAERGKLLCANGRILEISVVNGVPDGGKLYEGGMFSRGYSDIVRFNAVKSSGELTNRSQASFCGVVAGKYSYSNSGGGTTHTVKLVGMFNLPENRL